MESYMDFGVDTDSEDERFDGRDDSEEEEEHENARLFKLLMNTPGAPRRPNDVDDFEAEMEAELDKRALEVETRGGVTHQKKSLSRSSSSSSLNKPPSRSDSPRPGTSKRQAPGTHQVVKKRVKFTDETKNDETEDMSSRMETDVDSRSAASKPGYTGQASSKKYDDIYFDSDESEGEDDASKQTKAKKRNVMSNDELFYDPESDRKDQAWVDAHRRRYCSSPSAKGEETPNPLPNSDAVLNCPACFTVLCLDCQRHEIYKEQYRAMFVMNCKVEKETSLQVPVKQKKSWKWKRGKRDADEVPANLPSDDSFNPVRCKVCTTQVAVFDTDEVYHFFNVLSSHA